MEHLESGLGPGLTAACDRQAGSPAALCAAARALHVRPTSERGEGSPPSPPTPGPRRRRRQPRAAAGQGRSGLQPASPACPHPCRRPCAASPSPADAQQYMHERAPFDNVDMSETRVSHRQMHRSTSSTGASGLACHATPAMAAARRARTRSNTTEPAAVALAAAAAAAAAAGDSPPPPLPPPPPPTSFGVGHTPLPRMFLCT